MPATIPIRFADLTGTVYGRQLDDLPQNGDELRSDGRDPCQRARGGLP
jgi:hypothetical protein